MSIPPSYFLEDIILFLWTSHPFAWFRLVLSWQEFVSGYVMYPDEKTKCTVEAFVSDYTLEIWKNGCNLRAGHQQGCMSSHKWLRGETIEGGCLRELQKLINNL